MSGGWEGSNRRAELPPNWYSEIRPEVLRRDRRRCQWPQPAGGICGAHANQVDHIGDGDDHRPANLQALCETCHRRKTSAQGNTARWAERARRPPERHPGFIDPP
ncbi:HNH endonuclease signature motif containing protein [Streptomyces sp. CAU 1734]|uniref:HNH endonuclease n=1 Tax=Streptomyces sp. CAU 1734 TaxID=3140360 RepID=UPI00325FE20D